MSFTKLCLFIIAALIAACSQEKTRTSKYSELNDKIDRLLAAEASGDLFSGSVLVGQRGDVLYHGAYGVADRAMGAAVQTHHRFDIASLNKSMVGALIMIASEEGMLSVNDRLSDHLSGYEYTGSFNDQITIHHMLTHTSGLPDYDAVSPELSDNDFRELKRMHFTDTEYVNFISRIESVGEPGKQFHYSNFAYHLLCIILEDLYEMDFGDLAEEKLFDPLKMSRTLSTTDNRQVIGGIVTGYTYNEGEWRKDPFIDLSIGRRVFSATSDLFIWANAFNQSGLLSQESLQRIRSNHLGQINPDISYGYGWVVYGEKESYRMGKLPTDMPYIVHGGATDGYKSLLVNINKGEWVIAILANSGNRTDELGLGAKITEILMKHSNDR